jgi:hypothetical protein
VKPELSMIERMAEAYWNAFREGYIAVGGRPESYPTWQQSRDPQKDETIRCLRHAVELLREDFDMNAEYDRFDLVFPDAPQPRKLRPTPTDQAFLTQTDMGKAFDA